jgi:hypothetical protein
MASPVWSSRCRWLTCSPSYQGLDPVASGTARARTGKALGGSLGVATMRSAGVRRMLVSMTAEIAHIEIEVSGEGEAISGEACRVAGRPKPFTAWLDRCRAAQAHLAPGRDAQTMQP